MTVMRPLARYAAIVVVLGVMLGAIRWCVAPPLRVKATAHGVRLDVATLGEYPTTVESIRRTEAATGTVGWAVQGRNEMQLWGIDLQEGPNPVAPDTSHGAFEVVVPHGVQSFVLRRGVAYTVQVCGSTY